MIDHEWPVPHSSGSARSQGYYKIPIHIKAIYLSHVKVTSAKPEISEESVAKGATSQAQTQQSQGGGMSNNSKGKDIVNSTRQSRLVHRQLKTSIATTTSDILQLSDLKARSKRLAFGKSLIHNWGLFSMQDIEPQDMVIEYIGECISSLVADLREAKYEKQGIGSSYLFRSDRSTVIDATKMGNLARFINHSCDPNCHAQVISIRSQKKIVFYAKRAIAEGEEITYNYKFPIEDEKIPCLCGAANCRGTLN